MDYMGGDAAIVQAARVSYGTGTKRVSEDTALIRYLIRHRHTTPFEMCEIKLHVRVPMDTWRQWIRHRTANVNEYSTRYSVAIDAAQGTAPGDWRLQARGNSQGSEGNVGSREGEILSREEKLLQKHARAVYESRLATGVAREQARKDLPLSTYTEAYWKIDLHNLLHFLDLRMDLRAQEEIRHYANVIGSEIVARWCPTAWQAFLDYRLNSLLLTARELAIVECLVKGRHEDGVALAVQWGWLDSGGKPARPNRERAEANDKLTRLGLVAPWAREELG